MLFQACRGTKLDYGAELPVDEVDALITDAADPPAVRKIPTAADFLMAYSVVPGSYMYSNTTVKVGVAW